MTRRARSAWLWTCCLVAIVAWRPAAGGEPARGDTPVTVREFIYETASFPECHASTIADVGDRLVAAWFGGTEEGDPDVGIWVSRKPEGGPWSSPVEVANGIQHVRTAAGAGETSVHRHPCWNPVLFQPPPGGPGRPLLLFYKCGPSPDAWWGMLTTSEDAGATWSPPRRLPEGILGPVKNKPIALEGGILLCGSSTEHEGWRVHFERTRDLGLTWERTGPIRAGTTIDAIQPCLLSLPGGRVEALGRSGQGRIWRSVSEGSGVTWSALELTDLPNPNSGIDAVTLRDGRAVLVYNHTRGGRSPLNVAVRSGTGPWQAALVLESEPGEYSYPAVIQARDERTVHITYTWKRTRIRHVALDPDRLEPRPFRDGRWPE